MKRLKNISITALLMAVTLTINAQDKKIWVSGAARAVMYGDDYTNESETDTVTAPKTQGGHAMVDLGVNINPNDQLLIQGMVRIRNDYGGFWGSGVTFDVRQLYIKGILGGFLKYQLGDINYKLSPYTFQNSTSLIDRNAGVITSIPLEQVQYDVFYTSDQTWRQQGGAIDFALEFDKVIEEVEFNAFTTRILPSNYSTVDDRLYSGGSVILKQSHHLKIGGQYANLYDFKGTSNSTVHLRNPVYTGSLEYQRDFNEVGFNVALETGQSLLEWTGSEEAPVLEDYFYDVAAKANLKKYGIAIKGAYRNVGPNFRSAGAQTIQVNYNSAPRAYQRYGNEQAIRQISMLDLYRDASLYQTQIVEGLMNYDPRYDNATPYGRATPNRKGVDVNLDYEDVKKRWKVGVRTDFLSDVVGEGTEELKSYQTTGLSGELNIGQLMGLKKRRIILSGRYGWQNTDRDGVEDYEDVDLASTFQNYNLTVTLFGDLDLLAEYRVWQTSGFDLYAERNQYSQIVDFTEYNINYSEDIIGAGLQYGFSEKTKLSLMWQLFNWEDELQTTQSYAINNWSLFFTMKF